MMKYESLLLENGGGISPSLNRAPMDTAEATLVVGLGGVGIEALSRLKEKVHRQLYTSGDEGIQFLGIDLNEDDLCRYSGNGRLEKGEFFSLSAGVFDGAARLLEPDEQMRAWFPEELIEKSSLVEESVVTRPFATVLLMRKANELAEVVKAKCRTAMAYRGTPKLNVYILSGLGGTTSSNILFDVCYIIGQVAGNEGWTRKTFGYFFMPDVICSRPGVPSVGPLKQRVEANGYATLKRLNYLMDLSENNGRFERKYGPLLHVYTQDTPVDLCYLISSKKADEMQIRDSFSVAINTVSDHIVSYLSEASRENWFGADGQSAVYAHLSNVFTAMAHLPKQSGAIARYSTIGSCTAEPPARLIAAYLAGGLYRELFHAIESGKNNATLSDAKKFLSDHHLGAKDVFARLSAKTAFPEFSDDDRKRLLLQGMPGAGALDAGWANSGNDWLDRNRGEAEVRKAVLMRDAGEELCSDSRQRSLCEIAFNSLESMATNSDFGLVYARETLAKLILLTDEEITAAQRTVLESKKQLDEARQNLEESKKDFYEGKGLLGKMHYENFKASVANYYEKVYFDFAKEQTVEVLKRFKMQLEKMENAFFRPLFQVLNNLKETFDANLSYVDKDSPVPALCDGIAIPDFSRIRPLLDERISSVDLQKATSSFVYKLYVNREDWLSEDPKRIAAAISGLTFGTFEEDLSRSFEEYLEMCYEDGQSAEKLSEKVKNVLMPELCKKSTPLFAADDVFHQRDIVPFSVFDVPASADAVYKGVCAYRSEMREADVLVRKTASARIKVLTEYHGLPLYAFEGIAQLKKSYEDLFVSSDVKTRFCSDGAKENADPLGCLPTPLPYSLKPELVPEGEAILALYDEGLAAGVIAPDQEGCFEIRRTTPYERKGYTMDDFYNNGRFGTGAYEAEKKAFEEALNARFENCETFSLEKNGFGTVVPGAMMQDRVCRDYFILHPFLQAVVREELEKEKARKEDGKILEKIVEEAAQYESDLESYCNLIFYKRLNCQNILKREDYAAIDRIFCLCDDPSCPTGEFDFSLCHKMPYGKRYPLYQGFLTYCSLSGLRSPRRELDQRATEDAQSTKTPADFLVPAQLDLILSDEETAHLTDGVILSGEEIREITRFYNGFCRRIRDLKKKTSVWPII